MAEDDTEPAETSRGAADPLGVKVGSTRTVVARDGDGPAIDRALTCLATYEDALTGEERVLFGEAAATEYPDRVRYTLRSGLPEDEESADLTRTYLREFASSNDLPAESVVVLAIPTIDNPTGLDRLESIVDDSPVGEVAVRSYPESLCGAVPALGDGLEAIEDTFIAINLGSTNLEASAFRRGEQIAPYSTGAVTGSDVDRRIATNVEEETQGRVNVDLQTAREYKETHADFVDYEPFTDVIQQPGGGTYEYTIETSVMDAMDAYLDRVVDEIANVFLPELANDQVKLYNRALERPIVLTGGMACVPGIVEEFADRLSAEMDRPIEATAPERPEEAAAVGAYRIAERLVELDAY
ncbi:MAG: hypothetical protein ABEJ76_00300 [Halanaeroarchaeum sp.]